jgi:steroid 5-alpha reductase family enzyme
VRIVGVTDVIGWPGVPLVALGAVLTMGTLLWFLSLRLRDASIVDIFWGPLFLALTIVYVALLPDGFAGRQLLVLGLVATWSIRLATHIAARHAGKGEDERYARWRRQHGAAWPARSLFQVFWLQAVLAWIISAPLLVAIGSPEGWGWLAGVGVAIWIIGFGFEAIGDYQLTAFTRDPDNRGRTMRSGLWRYSRHPNYFGDAAQWWGLWLIATAAGGWWTVFAPLLMTFLLVRVSGVGLLESTIADRREGYADYMASTSAFIPLPPRQR